MLGRDFAQFLDEDCAKALQTFDHITVVDDLVADIDRGAVLLQRQHDDLDRPIDTGAKTARLAKPDRQLRFRGCCVHCFWGSEVLRK